MAQDKPIYEDLFAENGSVASPDSSTIKNGNIPNTIAISRLVNFADNRQDEYIKHINQYGIPVWDNTESYPAGAWSRSSVDGEVYEALQLVPSGLTDPQGQPTYWINITSGKFVPIAGNAGNPMTGALYMGDNNILNIGKLEADLDTSFLIENIGTGNIVLLGNANLGLNFTGSIDCGSSRVANVDDPFDLLDAVNLRTLKLRVHAYALWDQIGGVVTVHDSFNMTSVIRTTLGFTEFVMASSAGNTDYIMQTTTGRAPSGQNRALMDDNANTPRTNTTFRLVCKNDDNVFKDVQLSQVIIYKLEA